jgi:hypothetical protein
MSEAVVLGHGQLYMSEATPRAYTTNRGPIRLYEDIIQALYENTHFMKPLLTNDLKLQHFSYFFVVVITIQLIKTWYDCMIQALLEWHLHQKIKSYWDLFADLDWKQDFCTCVAKFHSVLIYFCFHFIFNKVLRNLWKICFVPHYMLFAINTAVIF